MMRKIILPFIVLLFATAGKAQYVTIPDTLFRNFLMVKYPSCFNASKQMDTTCNKIVTETSIDATNLNFKSISGIEYFDSLKNLNVSNNKIDSIKKFPNNLRVILCYNNQTLNIIPTLPSNLQKLVCGSQNGALIFNFKLPSSLPNNLHYLGCYSTFLLSLPALPNNIDTLILQNCHQITLPSTLPNHLSQFSVFATELLNTMPNLPLSLKDLNIASTNITALPNMPSQLVVLNISITNISALQPLPNSLKNFSTDGCKKLPVNTLQLPVSLTLYSCTGCNYDSLPALPNTLTYLNFSNNNLTTLPTSFPSGLEELIFSFNPISSITQIPSSLSYLDCSGTLINSLPALPSGLKNLLCYNNLNLHCLPKLPYLNNIYLDSANIKCLPNAIFGLNVYDYITLSPKLITLPVCNATNNPNQCEALPTVMGKVFYDNNSNGVKDANEPYKVFGEVALSNGDYSFTDTLGRFAITTDNIGTYTVTATPPTFFNAVPASKSITFNTYDTTVVLPDIALQPNVVKDSLQIFATPLFGRARPGFEFPYLVSYRNLGTTSLVTAVDFTFDNNLLNFNYCSNPAITNLGSIFSLITPNMVPGEIGGYIADFNVKPTAPIGDTLKATASINSLFLAKVYDAPEVIITGSFDPNDKAATPSLTPLQVLQGKPINYTIRFQNTGNDTAFTVVLADTLSNLLQTNTLQVLNSSHPCKVSVKNGVAYFEFKNINLPYKAINEIKSHGFVRFTVKPKTTLTLGTNIYNKAYIYFDYNAPIITNTAVTVIKNPVLPVKFMNYEAFTIHPKEGLKNWTVLNTWITSSEINVSHFSIQKSVDGKSFETVGTVKSKGNGAYNFTDELKTKDQLLKIIYYRLEVVDKDGSKSYSEIKQIRLNQLTDKPINVYPNPATTTVNIDCKDAKQILITDYLGRTVYQSNVHCTSYIVNLTSFTKGLYVVKVIANNNIISFEKFIKQ